MPYSWGRGSVDMTVVGLTGGIGAGKSTVASRLAELGATVFDADAAARQVVAPGKPGLKQLVEIFGPEILDRQGRLDRVALGRMVFEDSSARARLEAVLHPLIWDYLDALRAQVPSGAVVVEEIPLLVETGAASRYDLVVVVDTPVERQVERLVTHRGLSVEDARLWVQSQASREQRLAAADVVLSNEGSRENLITAADRLWEDCVHGGGA